MKSYRGWLIASLCLTSITALAQGKDEKPPAPASAIAMLYSTGDNKVAGTVTFTEEADGVKVHAEITGLTPGKHGFHVHEFGDCSAADLTSAGAHFNPTNSPHAGPDASERHEGDMGNIEADASGKVTLDYLDHHISITSTKDKESVLGRSVIIHAKADDLKTQPAGDAGARIACGVIGIAKSK
ncbi:MAG: superoxide dismutase family protein [Verrucomicrobiota bacterium]